MLRKLRKKGQVAAELAILIVLVVAALLAIQLYVKRGMQGRVRDAVDSIDLGGQITDAQVGAVFTGNQYEPYYMTGSQTQTQGGSTSEGMQQGGAVTRSDNTQLTQSRDITYTVQGANQ